MPITPLCSAGVLEAGPQPSLKLISPFRSELKSSWLPPNPVASNHTYLKTILQIFAFTSCWVENESNGNSRQGVELDWNAPTLTCSGRHGAQRSQSGVKSSTFLREEKSPERFLALPPAHSTNTRARAFSSPLKEGSRKQKEHLEGNSWICWWSVLTAPIQPSPHQSGSSQLSREHL